MTQREGDPDQQLFALHLKAFGARVREIRVHRRLTQEDLDAVTGIGRTRISAIEGGDVNVSLEVLWRLARALRVHPAELLDDREPLPGQPPAPPDQR